MIRIYQDQVISIGDQLLCDQSASQHLLRVLRLRVGESLVVFNGQGGEYLARLQANPGKQALLHIDEFHDVRREPNVAVHLGQCLSRGERMDYALQKSVEVGVAQITPIMSERCGVKLDNARLAKRMQHWQKVIISACEQSGRTEIPKLNLPQPLTAWVHDIQGSRFICDVMADSQAAIQLDDNKTTVLIGPEGGFSQDEIDTAHKAGFQSLSLGRLVLRTETAPVVAVSLLSCI